jgi:hypothetical protein
MCWLRMTGVGLLGGGGGLAPSLFTSDVDQEEDCQLMQQVDPTLLQLEERRAVTGVRCLWAEAK